MLCVADEDALKKLDSSLKRNTAFINRLKKVSEDTCASLLDDIKKLNLSKYVSEAVSAIAESQLKSTDVQVSKIADNWIEQLQPPPTRQYSIHTWLHALIYNQRCNLFLPRFRNRFQELSIVVCMLLCNVLDCRRTWSVVGALSSLQAAVQVCSLLHQRYEEFSGFLAAALAKSFSSAGKGAVDDFKRKRSLLRLMCEVLLCGVVTNAAPLMSIVQDLSRTDFGADKAGASTALSLLLVFVKCCKEACLGKTAASRCEDWVAEWRNAKSTYNRAPCILRLRDTCDYQQQAFR